MTNPEPPDEPLAALFASLDRDAPPPDRSVLDRLREESLAAFNAESATPSSPRKPIMLRSSFRWFAAGTAAVLLLGVVVAQWVRVNRPPIVDPALVEKFVAGDGLVDDGRIGKVTDAQGVVAVKPVLHERWSPVQPQLVLKPGDWLRTGSRGANAVALKLLPTIGAIVGPHSTVELFKANEIRLLTGEIEIAATADGPVALRGPDQQTVTITKTQHYRVEKETLVAVAGEPLWLKGFKGTTANESIGSLVAGIDGRDVPLTVGYHHVAVDIRDQIARTVIEESFVNRTDSVLEGVFYFPLPADASISGFGMWIGDQLVEADVVEKQRAREIYETILREKRDPGLLEWAGGNLFKARVYPIPKHSEKRIKISYTQVLPLQGHRYRYSYGLQSELLKQHPLRDLKIDLTIHSAAAVKAITSPTHPARIATTAHSGHVEFAAQEYTPTRDFEAVIETDARPSDVVVIPHRRGDDGYFLVQLTPPGAGGDWTRPLLPDGDPLRLLILADTSASMDKGQRATQSAVIAGLLGALTAKDTVNVAACDVNCDWAFDKPVAATAANLAVIDAVLAKRTSLGWTDLDKAFAAAMAMCEPGTHVVYIGDGIATTGDADPVAFSKRLARLYKGCGTFHAVAVGSSFEPAALKAIASLGGGSVRRVTGERGPQAAALELLTEIGTPTLRDLKIEFTGLRTARVYPEALPNIAAGTQQILLGRYLPEGKDQAGEIVVTGTLGGKPVRFASKVSLKDAEQGNAFIPRLWARMHLDKLLEQGTSETVKQDVIALSEEFNIITPYTSLLVLESDADRERFAVKRRFAMRDGERFFADGRDNATYELKQKQMKQAGDYRTALRRSVLAQLGTLGRSSQLFQRRDSTPFGGFGGGGGRGGEEYFSKLGVIDNTLMEREDFPEVSKSLSDSEGFKRKQPADEFDTKAERGMRDIASDGPVDFTGRMVAGLKDSLHEHGDRMEGESLSTLGDMDGLPGLRISDQRTLFASLGRSPVSGYARLPRPSYALPWLGPLVPVLGPPAVAAAEPKTPWPAAAVALSRSLLRNDALAQQKGGIILVRQTDSFDAQRNSLIARNQRTELVSPTAWLTRSMPDGGPVSVTWCDGRELASYQTGFQLGRTRIANAPDLQQPPLELADLSLSALHRSYASYAPGVEVLDKERTLLILTPPGQPDHETRFHIDTTRHVLLRIEQRTNGKLTAATMFGDFVEVAGTWWARTTETVNGKNERLSLATQTVTAIASEDFAKRLAAELAGKPKVLFLQQPLPTPAAAKADHAAGKGTFDDHAALAMHFAGTQQWTRAREHVEACERLAAGKAGMRWLMHAYLQAARKHDDLRTRYLDDAATIGNTTDADMKANDYFLAEHLFGQARLILSTEELITLNDRLQPVCIRQPAHLQAVKTWQNRRVMLLMESGQPDKALVGSKQLAIDFPRDSYMQYQHAQNLANSGDHPAAYAWLGKSLEAKWNANEEASLRGLFVQFLQQQSRYREQADYLADWLTRDAASEARSGEYLGALVRSNRANEAEKLVDQWLRDALAAEEQSPVIAARRDAAVSFALGQGRAYNTNRVEERWHALLAETALHFARSEEDSRIASTILQHYRFNTTDAAKALRKTLAGILLKEVGTLPAGPLESFVFWVSSDAGLAEDDFRSLSVSIRKRWDAEMKPEVKHQLAQPLVRILGRLGVDELLAFLRVQWKDGPETHRTQYANQLFDTLLAQHANQLYDTLMPQRWTSAMEDETFTMLDKLAAPEEPSAGLLTRITALHRVTDVMLEGRYQERLKTVEHPEKLTRIELQKKQDEFRKLAREGYAEHLRKLTAEKPFAHWLTVERLWLETLLERDLKPIAAECWTILDGLPAKVAADDDVATLDEVLRERVLVMLESIAARKGADPALTERLLKHLDRQLAEHPGDGRWQSEKYRLLVALDRPADLEKELRQWLSKPDAENRWRLALGYLLAEQGRVPGAIALFEAVQAADELSPAAYRSLADWYLVENRHELHEQARAAVYKTTEEYRLSQQINVYMNPWRNANRLPTHLDAEVLTVFQVLFEKSATPQNYLGQLQQFYQASRDFRLLAMLPDGVIGHSAGKVYPFLGGMAGVLGEVRDEATADELLARILQVRPTAKTAVDQRALDLLELLVVRRAAEVRNQPGPHADKALAAIQRAFRHEWSAGEPRLMADFLANLGSITPPALAAEQLRQLDALHREAAAGTFDRLHIAYRYALALSSYSRLPEATDRLQAALKEYEEACAGTLPASANTYLDALITFTENARHYDRGEKILAAQFAHPAPPAQKNWLVLRINRLHQHALRHDGEDSLGKGADLYKALEKKLSADLETTDPNHRYQVLQGFSELYRTARDRKFPGVGDDLAAFAFRQLPPLLAEQINNYESLVRTVGDTLHDLVGPREAIRFLLDCADREPDWRRYTNQDAWTQHHQLLGEWRLQVKDLGDLEPRLLQFVLAELRRDLTTRETRSRSLYSFRHNYHWPEKTADFAKVAEEVLAARKASSESVEYIAEYVFFGLPNEKRAVEILFDAHARKMLAVSGQHQLVDYLHRTQRYAESIPLLLPLVEIDPENLNDRTRLMHAYYRVGKPAELLALLKDTDQYFHAEGRWHEGPLAGLASSCVENHLYDQAVAYYAELIPLHQNTQPRRGIGNGTLSNYYAQAAQAYAGLGRTKEAVDRACGAVVSWGPTQTQRTDALNALVQILTTSADLNAYAAELDREKLQSAVIRKALGKACVTKEDHARAIPHLLLAAELQPDDAETYAILLTCYDAVGDKEGAVRQLLKAVEASRRDLALFAQLGRRLGELKQPGEAERAYTSIVEMLPHEAESHAMLGEIREKQDRWADAVPHWERVAALRALEPTGLQRLAAAQIHLKAWDAAAATVQILRSRTWPPRFGDGPAMCRELEKQIEARAHK